MIEWLVVDVALAALFGFLAFRMHRKKARGMKWFFILMAALWLGFAAYQWFRVHPGSWPF